MTLRMFDPNNYSRTSVSSRPEMLHFQFSGSEDVFRYVLAERIPLHQINSVTRRKEGEGKEEGLVRKKYLKDTGEQGGKRNNG